jgi:hypothetical protein
VNDGDLTTFFPGPGRVRTESTVENPWAELLGFTRWSVSVTVAPIVLLTVATVARYGTALFA